MKTVSMQKPPWWIWIVFGRRPQRTLIRVTLLVALTFLVFKFLVIPIQVTGMSMAPTYQSGRINFVNQLAYAWSKPKRGDVVVVRTPGERYILLKRIVGLPGERVALREGKVWINGDLLDEPYMRRPWKQGISYREITVEPDHYFVVGDNRGVSVFRPVPIWQIVGKVMF